MSAPTAGRRAGGDGLLKKSRFLRLLASIGTDCEPVVGPQEVMIDFCNNCNLHCLCCYNYSPLGPPRLLGAERTRVFPYEAMTRVIKDCAALGVRKLNLAGMGEPLMHPQAREILTEIRRHGIGTFVTTNGTLVSRLPWSAPLLDNVLVSMHAGSEEVYRRMHPKDPADTFQRVRAGLALMREAGVTISIGFVLCSENWEDFGNVIDLASEFRASVALQPIRPFIRAAAGQPGFDPQRTGELRLTREQVSALAGRTDALVARAAAGGVPLYGFTDYVRLLAGNGGSGAQACGPTRSVYDRQPCYIGWFSSRIRMDGTVTPCCQCDVVLGDVNQRSFAEIWRSPEYRRFRSATLAVPFNGLSALGKCECDICDVVPRNRRFHDILTGSGLASMAVRAVRPFIRRGAPRD